MPSRPCAMHAELRAVTRVRARNHAGVPTHTEGVTASRAQLGARSSRPVRGHERACERTAPRAPSTETRASTRAVDRSCPRSRAPSTPSRATLAGSRRNFRSAAARFRESDRDRLLATRDPLPRPTRAELTAFHLVQGARDFLGGLRAVLASALRLRARHVSAPIVCSGLPRRARGNLRTSPRPGGARAAALHGRGGFPRARVRGGGFFFVRRRRPTRRSARTPHFSAEIRGSRPRGARAMTPWTPTRSQSHGGRR